MATARPLPLIALRGDDFDPEETQEWLESIDSVLRVHGAERAHFLLECMIEHARRSGAYLPYSPNTAYLNTIPVGQQPEYPGDRSIERRIEGYIRWNAMAMVVHANRISSEYGGHIASYASSATLYEVGFNHFWRAPTADHGGDLVYFQGHSSPGIYGRAFLEGRLDENNLNHFRREVAAPPGVGLSSYPHPWLMPEFWQFPTVSMGLGPMMAIYQARFMRYLEHRGILPPQDRKVWCFLGDGETDEPESMGAITMPVRERLDNLIFVINCNLQRLDGPVRGNGKIIQELEAAYQGAGWNVIKVVWGSRWDPLLARDDKGLLRKAMEECVDGDYQAFKAKGGTYTREHFFGRSPELKAMVAHLSDEDIWHLNRGGHDPEKVYAAYHQAVHHKGRPTVILAKTVKGFGMGEAGEGQNITHQKKKLDDDDLKHFRDRFHVPISDEDLARLKYYKPADNSEEMKYLKERRTKLGGSYPVRRQRVEPLEVPGLEFFKSQLEGSGDREFSTTMAFVRILTALIRDKNIGRRIVPIVPDEARTFGMEGMFRQVGIYSSLGQLYTPQDSDQLSYYRESKEGQILEEGINEGGSYCSWIAAATSYANHGVQMIPFYIYYSMFGFQRIGDFAWAGGDMRARGFLLGGTAGRTTLAGEGLQHQDGHSQLVATTIPNCRAYDPCFNYELAVIIQDGLRRMCTDQESVFYYITVMNENYAHPAMPAGAAGGHPAGHVSPEDRRQGQSPRAALGLRHDSARGARGRRAARAALQHSGRRLERHELQRAAARSARRRALERAPSRGRAAYELRGSVLRRHRCRRSVRRGHGLHEDRIRPDSPVGARALRCARHGRFRAQRRPRSAAAPLRGRPQVDRHRGTESARRRGQHRSQYGQQGHERARRRSGQAESRHSVSRRKTLTRGSRRTRSR